MNPTGILMKTFWAAAVLAALFHGALGQGKPTDCCKTVNYNEIQETVIGYRVQRPFPPCVAAIIFLTEKDFYCKALDAPWILPKIAEINKAAMRRSSAKPSLLSAITSGAKPSSSTPSSSS
ncbi:uncharacterized protein LOC144091551 isoform X2 [Stigmatopora argus]